MKVNRKRNSAWDWLITTGRWWSRIWKKQLSGFSWQQKQAIPTPNTIWGFCMFRDREWTRIFERPPNGFEPRPIKEKQPPNTTWVFFTSMVLECRPTQLNHFGISVWRLLKGTHAHNSSWESPSPEERVSHRISLKPTCGSTSQRKKGTKKPCRL